MDFNIKTYRKLLESLIAGGYSFQTLTEFLDKQQAKSIILRHDVEAKYENALAFAKIQKEYQVRGTYYFRFLPNHFSTEIIKQIASIGHEIGYHYDDLSHCKGDYNKALQRFEKNLATLRKIAEVKTICMEGAPLSRWDNRNLWLGNVEEKLVSSKKYEENSHKQLHTTYYQLPTQQQQLPKFNYKDHGIIGEPYFDLDFSRVLYLTDTGRRWDGSRYSVRDKVGQLDSWQSAVSGQQSAVSGQRSAVGGQRSAARNINSTFNIQHSTFHSTSDIIAAANLGQLPDQIMLTFHPQRWTDKPLPWAKELILQNLKNVVKLMVVRRRK